MLCSRLGCVVTVLCISSTVDVFANDALYFIKDDVPFAGTLGNNLLHLITVQTTHRLKFTWNTDPDEIVTYKWAFNSTDLRVLARPYLSINHTGIVPREEGNARRVYSRY